MKGECTGVGIKQGRSVIFVFPEGGQNSAKSPPWCAPNHSKKRGLESIVPKCEQAKYSKNDNFIPFCRCTFIHSNTTYIKHHLANYFLVRPHLQLHYKIVERNNLCMWLCSAGCKSINYNYKKNCLENYFCCQDTITITQILSLRIIYVIISWTMVQGKSCFTIWRRIIRIF